MAAQRDTPSMASDLGRSSTGSSESASNLSRGWTSGSNLTLESARSHLQSVLEAGEPRSLSVRGRELTSDSFYQLVEQYEPEDADEDLLEWLSGSIENGVVQVYTPGSTYCDLVKCTICTTAETIMAKCFSKELYVHYGGRMRKLDPEDRPLYIQNEFLRLVGYDDHKRLQLEGISPELGPLFKFVAGVDAGDTVGDRVQLNGVLKVKESGLVSTWGKRFCILVGSKLFIFPSIQPKRKPNLTVILYGSSIEEYKTKKHGFGIRITQPHKSKVVSLGFSTISERTRWTKGLQKVINKHPNEAILTNCSLTSIPKFLFYNKDLSSLNLAQNFLSQHPQATLRADFKEKQSSCCINDLCQFPRLNILSLSFNNLRSFPISLCKVSSLVELDLSSNQLQNIPGEISLLVSLRSLHLGSNQLSALPVELSKLRFLSVLVLNFNEFDEVPPSILRLPLLKALLMAGNMISELNAQDMSLLKNLEHLDLRLNPIEMGSLPPLSGIRNLSKCNLSHTHLTTADLKQVPMVTTLNISCCQVEELDLYNGPLKTLFARENCLTEVKIISVPASLTTLDLAKCSLSRLPEAVDALVNLERFDISNNSLTYLPQRLFSNLKKLRLLKVSNNKLRALPNEIGNVNLEDLDLHSNQLEALPEDLIIKLTKLEVLNVSDNKLSALPPPVAQAEENTIMELYAGFNKLKNDSLEVVHQFKKLKILILCHNLLSSPGNCFQGLVHLETLSLSGNQISSIGSLRGCVNLQKLLLSDNELTETPIIANLSELTELDLSLNEIEILASPLSQLNYLDVSENVRMEVSNLPKNVLNELGQIDHLVLDEIVSFDQTEELANAEQVVQPSHEAWTFGYCNLSGQGNEPPHNSASFVVVPNVNNTNDSTFAIIDGGKSLESADAIRAVLADIVDEEYILQQEGLEEGGSLSQEDVLERLQYLRQSMLSFHRKLGAVSPRSGLSVFLCHIVHKRDPGTIELHAASTGACEGLLQRETDPVPLIPPHCLKTNIIERERVAELGGSVSEDFRLNGVYPISRGIGSYHMWPFLFPLPDIAEVSLKSTDHYIVLANEHFWKVITENNVRDTLIVASSAMCAAKMLRDTALSFGCKANLAIVVLKFRKKKMEVLLGSIPEKRPKSTVKRLSLRIPDNTHHYRLEIESPLLPETQKEEGSTENLFSDADVMGSPTLQSPEGIKWTCIDDPLSPSSASPNTYFTFSTPKSDNNPSTPPGMEEGNSLREESTLEGEVFSMDTPKIGKDLSRSCDDILVSPLDNSLDDLGSSPSLPNLLSSLEDSLANSFDEGSTDIVMTTHL